jgi:hypothetical protein
MARNPHPATATQPLAASTQLSQYVFFSEPTAQASPTSRDPRLVVMASWMDARDAHIAKYTARYQQLYPTARILLVKMAAGQFFWRRAGVRAVQPAVSYLRSQLSSGYLSLSPAQPQVLVHVFSNGGVASARNLFETYRGSTGDDFPLHVAVYDSCPGRGTYATGVNAMMASVPSGPWQWLLAPVVHAFLALYLVWTTVMRQPDAPSANGDFHNDPARVRQAGRAYVYGTQDDMVLWQHVELHAEQAEARGYVVRKECFPHSPHVAHARSDGARYWSIVTETWTKARGNA